MSDPKTSWKTKLVWGGLGLLWGAVLFFATGVWFLRTNLIDERECPLPWEAAVKRFPEAVMKNPGWTVRTVPCGLPVPVKCSRVAVFEICSRKYAGEILKDPDARKTAAVLPCKIAIYERGDKTFIARLNGGVFMRLLGGAAAKVFTEGIRPEQTVMLNEMLASEESGKKANSK